MFDWFTYNINYKISPNAEEALSLLSMPLPPSKVTIEEAADKFLEFGVGNQYSGWVIIRSGELGAFIKSRVASGRWVDAFWTSSEAQKVVDVTGKPVFNFFETEVHCRQALEIASWGVWPLA